MKPIDLRSDTVTKPSKGMLEFMLKAEVGDDVYGEDPTVNELEALGASLMGMEAALFVPSGTQSNLLALLTHCERGDEYIAGQTAHTYLCEGGGAAIVGGIHPQPLAFEPDGTLDLSKVKALIKPDNDHFARTRLLCLENTQSGLALPPDYPARAVLFAKEHHLKIHLDGARIFNAAIKHHTTAREIAHGFDSVSVCLSKGLGAPAGSLLCSNATFIKRARRWRKVLGGGMRQAGILAAAGIYALKNNIERLGEDHRHASVLAKGLGEIGRIRVHYPKTQTNMVFVDIGDTDPANLSRSLGEQGILIHPAKILRLVTHRDVSAEAITTAIDGFKNFYLSTTKNSLQ
ncbi:MAG: low-specificity L-threonine aldolase [Deltaproteobacteria bacterium]|nr:low-specificity L-threonine aldolase [Deltaproteobacteria bacterium]